MSRRRLARASFNAAAVLVLVVTLFPIYWMVATGFKRGVDILSFEPRWLPIPGTLENYRAAISKPHFLEDVRNSLVVVVVTVLVSLALAFLAALAAARFRFRGQALLIVLVGTVLSTAFALIGLPYWLLVGSFAGLVEMVPVIGPLAAGALAIGVGFTQSWHVGLAAGVVVLLVRLLEDYLILPKVLGEATGLSPLVVLFSVSAVAILFGGFAVLLAVPLAAVVATLVDVVVRGRDPAEEEVPTVLFPAKDAEEV